MTSSPGTAGGATAFEGFLYQVDISILAALELLIDLRRADRIVLEPIQEDDIEAEVDEADPGPVAGTIVLGPRTLVVQSKLRRRGPWRPGDVRALLQHGESRRSAWDRLLQEPEAGYLLATSTDVSGQARDLIVSGFGRWPDKPPRAFLNLDSKVLQRVAILPMLHADHLEGRLRILLTDLCGVPVDRWMACRDALRAEARHRMLRFAGGVWTRADLEAVVVAHDGRPGRGDPLQGFVKPTNWEKMRALLRGDNAVLIDGPSGTGKTATAEVLAAELLAETPGGRIVRVTDGPDQARQSFPGPVIFMVEDPWGRYSLSQNARPWNNEIHGLLDGRSPRRRFIITSRSDIAREAKVRVDLQQWAVRLESGHYGAAEWFRLFERWRAELPAAHQLVVARYRAEILETLSTPFQLRRFFNAAGRPREEKEHDTSFIRRCLASAEEVAIEREVRAQIEARSATAAAAVVWALLAPRGRARRDDLDDVGRALAAREREFEDALPSLIAISIGAGNLRGDGPDLSYAHPRIEKAFVGMLREDHADATARRLGLLLTVLTSGQDFGIGWGPETASRVLRAAQGAGVRVIVPEAARAAVDAWVDAHLAEAKEDVRDALELAAAAGSSPAAEVARWLTNIDIGRMFEGGSAWLPTHDDEAWYAARAAEPLTRKLCEAFVQHVLPEDRIGYPNDFAKRLARLSPDLGAAFRSAALHIVGYPYFSPAALIASGALDDLDAFAEVLNAALDVLVKVRVDDNDGAWLNLENGVYPDDYGQDLAERYAEDGYTAGVLIEAYVARLRLERGWSAVDAHPRASELVDGWLLAIARDDAQAPREERAAVARHALDSPDELRFWERASPAAFATYARQLAARLATGHPDYRVERQVAQVFRALAPADAVEAAEVFRGHPQRALAIAAYLEGPDEVGELPDPAANATAVDAIAAVLEPGARAAFVSLLAGAAPPPPSAESWLIATATSDDTALITRAGRALVSMGTLAEGHVEGLLTAATSDFKADTEGGLWAVEVLWSRGDWSGLRRALDHRMADVKVKALLLLGERPEIDLTAELMALAKDPSSRVMSAVLDLIATRSPSAFIPTLLDLCEDTWQPSIDRYSGDEADHPIARRAASLLPADTLSQADLARLAKLARATEDSDLRDVAMAAIARGGGTAGRTLLVDRLLDRTHVPTAAAAAAALFDVSAELDPGQLERVGIENLNRRLEVAREIALLIGAAAAPKQILDTAQRVLAHVRRRPLAVLIAAGAAANGRTDGVLEAILPLFGPGFDTAFRAAAAGDQKLPRDRIPAGDPVVVEAVARRLAPMLESRSAVEEAQDSSATVEFS